MKFLYSSLSKNYKIWLLLLALPLMPGLKCPDDDPPLAKELPPITTEGRNTFGCLVNGEVWLPESNTSFPELTAVTDKSQNYLCYIAACQNTKAEGIKYTINVGFSPGNSKTQFILNNNFNNLGRYIIEKSNTTYSTNNNISGELELLRYDSITQIISGTFWFNAIDSAANDTVKITDGRFDLHFMY